MSLNPFKKKSYVGIDIGHKTIKLVQAEKASVGWKITRTAVVPTPKDTVAESIINDPEMVGLTIKQALREHRFSAGAAVTSVSGGSVIVRLVRDMPKMNEATLRKSIKFEAGRYVPSSVEDSFIEFEILGESEEGQMNVLIAAAPREMVQSRVDAIAHAGLETDVVDVEAFAAYRALVETDEQSVLSDMTLALIDVGSSTTTVSVINRGTFVMTRTIMQAGQTWTDALQNYFKLSDEDAEAGKAQLDLSPLVGTTMLENQPLRVLQPHVDDLIREIRRSLNYYQSQQTDGQTVAPVSHLLVSGGGAKLHGLGDYLAHKLGLEVVCAGVFSNPHFIYAGQGDPGVGMELSVASGLALRPLMKAV